jgi:hypothetical protein
MKEIQERSELMDHRRIVHYILLYDKNQTVNMMRTTVKTDKDPI